MQDKLTDLEAVKIETFCADKEMFDAVKKVLLATVYEEGVVKKGKKLDVKNAAFNLIANSYQKNVIVSNDELGAKLRALFEGVDAVENGFAILKTITTKIESPYSDENEAI